MREPTPSERKLVNITMQLVQLAATDKFFKDKPASEVAEWAAKQLDDMGFKNEPAGSNYAYLTGVEDD